MHITYGTTCICYKYVFFKLFFYWPCVPIYKTAHCTYKKVLLQAMFVVFFPWWQPELLTRDSPVSGGTRLPLEWQQWILFKLVVKTVAICVRKIIAFSYIFHPQIRFWYLQLKIGDGGYSKNTIGRNFFLLKYHTWRHGGHIFPANTWILNRSGGTGEATASPEFRAFTTDKF